MMYFSGYRKASLAPALVIAVCASSAVATVLDYRIDPSYSSLTMTASSGGLQLRGGNVSTSLSGSLQADVTDSSIRFTGGTANASSSMGGSFGDPCWSWLVGVDADLNNLSLQLSSAPIAVAGGAFSASGAAVTAGGTLDSHGVGLLGWLLGGASSPLNAMPGGSYASGLGRIITNGSTQRVLVPINTGFNTTLSDRVPAGFRNVRVQLTGWIVADRQVVDDSDRPKPPDVPEPTTLLLLMGGGAAILTRRR